MKWQLLILQQFLERGGKAGKGLTEWWNNVSEIHRGPLGAAGEKVPGSRLICFVICFSGERHYEDRKVKMVSFSVSFNHTYCHFRIQNRILSRMCSILSYLFSAFGHWALCGHYY